MNLSMPLRSLVTTLEGRLFAVLAGAVKPLTGSAIARLVHESSAAGVRLALKRLVLDGTVLVEPVGGSLVYRANRDHLLWPTIERMLADAESVVSRLEGRIVGALESTQTAELLHHTTLAIYGSLARGDSGRTSDIDVLAVFPDTTATETIQLFRDRLQENVPVWTGNECSVYAVTHSRLAELFATQDPMVGSWVADARTIHGPDVFAGVKQARSCAGGARTA